MEEFSNLGYLIFFDNLLSRMRKPTLGNVWVMCNTRPQTGVFLFGEFATCFLGLWNNCNTLTQK